jgi:hypothetical protein
MLEELEGQRVKRAVMRRSNVKRASSPVAFDFKPAKGRARTPVSQRREKLGFQRGIHLFQFNLQKLQRCFASYDCRLQRKIGQTTIFQAYKSYPGRPLAVEIEKSVGFQILQSYLSMEVLSHIPSIGKIGFNFNRSQIKAVLR